MARSIMILLGLALAFCLIAGCGSSGFFTPTHDNDCQTVAAGTFRTLTASDTWDYSLSWTHNGNTYTGRTASVTLSQDRSEQTTYTLMLNFGAPYEDKVFKFRFTQGADGTLTLDGIQTIDLNAINDATPTVDAPAGDEYDTEDITGTTQFDGRDLEIDLTNDGIENVVAQDGNTYQCYKFDGTITEGGYAMDFTFWINPSIGNLVKLVCAYDELVGGDNALLTATLLLSETSLP